MKQLTIDELRDNQKFMDRIKWDVTPKILCEPLFPRTRKEDEEKAKRREGYMFYIEMVNNKPTLMVMNTFQMMSVTIGWIESVPEDLLKTAIEGTPEGGAAGMYAINEELKKWLKKGLGLI